jgi:hypothetical protein
LTCTRTEKGEITETVNRGKSQREEDREAGQAGVKWEEYILKTWENMEKQKGLGGGALVL